MKVGERIIPEKMFESEYKSIKIDINQERKNPIKTRKTGWKD